MIGELVSCFEKTNKSNYTNNKCNSFLYSFLNICGASFPTKYKNTGKIKMDA
jgi:hypothetical protein